MNIGYLKWLLNKCRYAAENGSEDYMRERFIQLIGAVEKIIKENDVKENGRCDRMTDKLKELIEKAPVKRKGTFKNFMIVSNGAYDGIWGENGFNSIILLGLDVETGEYVKITDYADVFNIYNVGESVGFNLDVPTEYGVPRIWFGKFITIDNELNISAVNGEVERK